jgi:hypothetical protein
LWNGWSLLWLFLGIILERDAAHFILEKLKCNTIPIPLNISYKPFSRVKVAQKPVYWLGKCTLKYWYVFSN